MNAAHKTTKHPFDFATLRKGTWIHEAELEQATFVKRTHDLYLRRVLDVRDMIEKETGILSRVQGRKLRLMTDAEALAYNIRQAKLASEKMERAATHLVCNIDREELTDAEKVVHEHAARVVVAMADAQRKAKARQARLFEFIATPNELGD